MDGSVYTPGAGHIPPVLAGRGRLIDGWRISLNDVVSLGRLRAQDIILSGPRGVGKTATMGVLANEAKGQGFEVVNLQAVAGHAGLVSSLMQRAAVLARQESGPWRRVASAFERLGGVSVGFAGVSASVTSKPATVSQAIDPGMLADTLAALSEEIVKDEPKGGLLIAVDELQVASAPDIALLAATLHRLNVEHPRSTVLFLGTGLPQISTVLSAAGVTHPDRLFRLEPLPLALDTEDARYAVVEPARRQGVTWEPDAVRAVLDASRGYPAHLQFYAHRVWSESVGPDTIRAQEALAAIPRADRELEDRVMRPRWSRMTDRQMEFLAALAVLDSRASVSALARALHRGVSDLSWIRDELLKEGDVYSPRRGELTFAVPAFAGFILEEYDTARLQSATALLSLSAMRRNAEGAS